MGGGTESYSMSEGGLGGHSVFFHDGMEVGGDTGVHSMEESRRGTQYILPLSRLGVRWTGSGSFVLSTSSLNTERIQFNIN